MIIPTDIVIWILIPNDPVEFTILFRVHIAIHGIYVCFLRVQNVSLLRANIFRGNSETRFEMKACEMEVSLQYVPIARIQILTRTLVSDIDIWPTWESKLWTKIPRRYILGVSEYHWDLSVNYHTSGYELSLHQNPQLYPEPKKHS